MIVLWSAASVASEWVRNEASEGKRRGILVSVFIEQIDAPLAFRSLNGADLSAWSGHGGDAEFVRLVERVSELLGQAGNESFAGGGNRLVYSRRRPTKRLRRSGRLSLGALYLWRLQSSAPGSADIC